MNNKKNHVIDVLGKANKNNAFNERTTINTKLDYEEYQSRPARKTTKQKLWLKQQWKVRMRVEILKKMAACHNQSSKWPTKIIIYCWNRDWI